MAPGGADVPRWRVGTGSLAEAAIPSLPLEEPRDTSTGGQSPRQLCGCWLEADVELSWANMAELIPEKHRLLIGALAEEINHALETSQKLLRQNQQLNLRAYILR